MNNTLSDAAAWAQIVGAIATAAAVVLALGLALREGQRQQAIDDDRDMAQARLCTVTMNRSESTPSEGVVVLRIHNYSNAPVRDMRFASDGMTSADGHPLRTGEGPGTSESKEIVPADAQWIPKVRVFDGVTPVVLPPEVKLQVTFTDARGLNWSIGPGRQPRRVLRGDETTRPWWRIW